MPYIISGPSKFKHKDYERVLHNGVIIFYREMPGKEDIPVYARSIPFIPTIAFVSTYVAVVTEAFRIALLQSGLTGFSFDEIIIEKLVPLDWKNWTEWKYPHDVCGSQTDNPDDYIILSPGAPADNVSLFRIVFHDISSFPNADFYLDRSRDMQVRATRRALEFFVKMSGDEVSFTADQ
jgi:hypothetical protein